MTASRIELLEIEVATLTDLLATHEEQAARQFTLIRQQQAGLEARARLLVQLNGELSSTASFLRELYRVTPGVLIVYDAAGIVESTNDEVTRLLGYGEGALIGKPVASLFDAPGLVELPALEALAARREIFRAERIMLADGGKRVPVLVSAALGPRAPDGRQRAMCVAFDLTERKALEVKLHQAQKLEAVGRLASGVAHEINTPIQFVSDSIQFLREATQDLLAVVDKLQAVQRSVLDGAPASRIAEEAEGAAAATEAADLPYLVEHMAPAFARSLEGLDRVAVIVRSMKEFAHPDAKEMAAVELHRAIESTLVIARNEYKYVAEVDTDFAALPPVTCHVGDVNQAVLNIIVNAAHAIGDVVAGTDRKGRISVRTHRHGDDALITIADTGGGIPDHVRDHVFDPFFTTKEVGKGTGQGLAIARAVIVEKHGGDITFETELGKGTTFTIRLPFAPPAAVQV